MMDGVAGDFLLSFFISLHCFSLLLEGMKDRIGNLVYRVRQGACYY